MHINHHSFNTDAQRLISQLELALSAAVTAHRGQEEREHKDRQVHAMKEKGTREKAKSKEPVRQPKSVVSKSSAPEPLRSIEPVKFTPDGHPIYIFGGVEFVKVPAGTFLMGSSDIDDYADAVEKPQHSVEILYDYYIGRFPITNEQYAAYVQAKGIIHPVDNWETKHDHPVVKVPWKIALAYCQWFNKKKKELPGMSFRLPTEAEWEKAARGVDGRLWPWGDIFDKNKCNTSTNVLKGFVRAFGIYTTPVDKFSPQGDSPYGVADMAGNVSEWTHSLLKGYPYEMQDGREGEQAGAIRVLRGGSFVYDARFARCASRGKTPHSNDRSTFFETVGFRMVIAPKLS